MKRRSLLFSWQLQGLVFLSGFSALLLEVVDVKLLRYWAGNTAYAVAAVLCAYMAGLSAGSLAAGKWLVRARSPLAAFGLLEFLVGLYSLALPRMIRGLEPAYLALTASLGPDTSLALFGHFLAAAALLLLPTLLMGASFPVVVRAGSGGSADRPEAATRLYAANLAGAALGALLSDFLLIRLWGMGNTLALVAGINAAVAVCALALNRKDEQAAGEPENIEEPVRTTPPGRDLTLFVALTGGLLVLFQEIVWTHMAGRFLDNTVYGFAVTLFAVIAGLGFGAMLVARRTAERPVSQRLAQVSVAAGILSAALAPFWDNARLLAVRHPLGVMGVAFIILCGGAALLALQSRVLAGTLAAPLAALVVIIVWCWKDPAGSIFWAHHGVDFAVCILFMAGPAALMGMIFPLVLEWRLGAGRNRSGTVATVYAANTLGSLAGIVVATFLALPRWGVERSGRAVALALFALGLALSAPSPRRRWAVRALPVLVWTLLMPAWDFAKTHAALGQTGKLVYLREDLNGGVTTVLRGVGTTRLYSNGLIQAGNDYLIQDQARFALIPVLHAREMERATVIGLGSGQTAGVVGLFPFKTIDLVDLSPSVVEAGTEFFKDINLGVYHQPNVRVHIADGRHYLLTHPEKLSLVTIEVTRLWVAGEGDLYTREFYKLCARRLAEGGVLQQWVPLFRLRFRDLVMVLRTVRAVFPHVALYLGAESGMMVASGSPLVADYARLREMDSNGNVRLTLARLKLQSMFSLLGDCVLVPEGVDALLAREPDQRVSTDLWPHLEHSSARYYLEGLTTEAARRFFLTAQEFRTVPISGLDPAARPAVEKWVLEERDRQLATLSAP